VKIYIDSKGGIRGTPPEHIIIEWKNWKISNDKNATYALLNDLHKFWKCYLEDENITIKTEEDK